MTDLTREQIADIRGRLNEALIDSVSPFDRHALCDLALQALERRSMKEKP